LSIPHSIFFEIEAGGFGATANGELVRRMEAKVKAAINRVWGI
jgi:hypothetical protein